MADYNWSTFTRRIPIKANVQSVYEAWTSRENLERWFLRKAEFKTADGKIRDPKSSVQVNDTYEWSWFGYEDETQERGKVLEANGKDFFKFVFGNAGNVSVKIKTEAGETICEIVQDNISTDEKSKINYHVGCSVGWTFYLANLKSILEGGIDLRNKDVNVHSVVSS